MASKYTSYRKELKKVHHELAEEGYGVPDKNAPDGRKIPRKVLTQAVHERFEKWRHAMAQARRELIAEGRGVKDASSPGGYRVSRKLLTERTRKIIGD
jgi:hypothetical protein